MTAAQPTIDEALAAVDPVIRRLAWRYAGAWMDAEDLAQELRWQATLLYRGFNPHLGRSVTGWMATNLRRRVWDVLRSRTGRDPGRMDLLTMPQTSQFASDDADNPLEPRDVSSDRAWAELEWADLCAAAPADRRVQVLLRRCEGQKLREIGDAMGISEASASLDASGANRQRAIDLIKPYVGVR